MIGWIRTFVEQRRAARRRWKTDAKELVSADPVEAYYRAQRLAARFRCAGEAQEFWHWSKVAAEVARIEPQAEMDYAKVTAINDREEARHKQRQFRASII